MNKLFWCGALAAMLAGPAAGSAAAGDLNLTISNGRVTLLAEDVTVRQILAEWARVGGTQIVNGDKMPGGPMTLELRDVPEAKALEIVLRSAAGYVVAPRLGNQSGPSTYERVVILATSNPPPVSSMPPPSFGAQPRPVPQRMMPQQMMPQQMMPPPVNANPGEDPEPANVETPVPGVTQPGQQPAPGPLTAPRPGPLPQPATGPGNPFQPGAKPGTPGGPPAPTRPGGGTDR